MNSHTIDGNVPVITVDGPAGSGKGTVTAIIAEKLGWHTLDSGALYRLTALSALKKEIPLEDEEALTEAAKCLDAVFKKGEIYLESFNVTQAIRTEECGCAASRVAAIGKVREALLQRQRDYRQLPGLIADGRDMGTVVFPDAPVKVFLTASPEKRAERRFKQLREKGEDVILERLVEEIRERDERDQNRSDAPMKPADDAILLDSSEMSIEQVVEKVMAVIAEKT